MALEQMNGVLIGGRNIKVALFGTHCMRLVWVVWAYIFSMRVRGDLQSLCVHINFVHKAEVLLIS